MIWWVVGSLALAGELVLDVDAAVERAWAHAGARDLAAREGVALAEVREAREGADPQLRVRAENVGSQVDPIQWTARIRQDLEPPGALRSAGRAARAEVDVVRAEGALARDQVRVDTVDAFDALRVALAAEALASDEVVLVRERLALATKRLDAGLPVADDVLDAEIEVLSAVRRAREAELERVAAQGWLALLVAAPPGDTPVPEGPPLDELALGEPAGARPSAALALADAEIAAGEAVERAERAERRPFPSWVEAGVQLEANTTPAFLLAGAFDIPVFSLAGGAVRTARAELDVRRAEADAIRDQAGRVDAAARARLVAAQQSVGAVREALAAAEARLEALGGQVAPDRRVDFAVEIVQERRRLLDLVAEALAARRVLER